MSIIGGEIFEYDDDGVTLIPLTCDGTDDGEYIGDIDDDTPIWGPLVSVELGEIYDPTADLPRAPTVAALTMPSRTSASVRFTLGDQSDRPHVTEIDVFRSMDGGAYSLVHTIDVAAGDSLTWLNTGLGTNTPERIWTYYGVPSNADGAGAPSAPRSVQWQSTPAWPSPAAALTAFTRTALTTSSVSFSWVAPDANPNITKHGLFVGNTLVVDNISAAARSYTWGSRTPTTVYTNVNIRRWDGTAWSPASNQLTFTIPSNTPVAQFPGDVRGRIFAAQVITDIGSGSDENKFAAAETQAQRQLGGWRLFNGGSGTNYANRVSWCPDEGVIPWVSLKPNMLSGITNGEVGGWTSVANGVGDAQIRTILQALRNLNAPVIFTFAHEPVGPSRTTPADAIPYTNAWRRILGIADTLTGGRGQLLMAPNHEEFVFKAPNTVNLAAWTPEDLMPQGDGVRTGRWDFYSFDCYMNNGNQGTGSNSDTLKPRLDRIFAFFDTLHGHGYPNLRYAVGETGARNSFRTANSSVYYTAATWMRESWPQYMARSDKFWLITYYNSIGSDTSLLSQAMMNTDTESLLTVYRQLIQDPVWKSDYRSATA